MFYRSWQPPMYYKKEYKITSLTILICGAGKLTKTEMMIT